MHTSGKTGQLVHRTNERGALVYVRLSPYVTCNWARAECTFHFVAN